MKRLWVGFSAVLLALTVAQAWAANPTVKVNSDVSVPSVDVSATPEMWFYQQYQKEYDDPQAMVHRNADARAAERTRRLTALRWFGMSNIRPRASTDPYNDDYSPRWVSGSDVFPSRWYHQAGVTVIVPREKK